MVYDWRCACEWPVAFSHSLAIADKTYRKKPPIEVPSLDAVS